MPEKEKQQNKKTNKLKEKLKKKQEVKELKQEVSRLKRLHSKAKSSARTFKIEFKKSINTAIVAAFGFLIALTWKEVITEWANITAGISPIQGKLIEAITITIISVLGILIITSILSSEKE